MEALPLILFSGMGADDGVFEPQLKSFPQLTVPRWIPPLPHEPSRTQHDPITSRHALPNFRRDQRPTPVAPRILLLDDEVDITEIRADLLREE